MNTKIVYVVVSDNDSLYAEQAVVSAYSARVYNVDAIIEAVVDTITADNLKDKKLYFYNYFDNVIVIDTPANYTQKQRSRYLKTKLREFVNGDYLYIDTDTIICDSLDEIDKFQNDICAVREYNRISHFSTTDRWMTTLAEKACLVSELCDEPYFNSGVMYVKETPCAQLFYKQWHNSWLKTKEYGVDTDQTALCWANKLEGHVINHIGDVWNCQIQVRDSKKSFSKAKIIHYFWELGESNYPLSHHSVFQSVIELEDIPSIVKDFIDTPKLQLVSSDDFFFIVKTNEMRSRFGKFCAFIEWICNVYFYMRENCLHRHIFKKILKYGKD